MKINGHPARKESDREDGKENNACVQKQQLTTLRSPDCLLELVF